MEYFITSASNVRTPCFGVPSLWQCEDTKIEPGHHRSGSSEEWMLHLRTLAKKAWLLDDIPPDGPRILFTKAWHERFFDNVGFSLRVPSLDDLRCEHAVRCAFPRVAVACM